MPLSSQLLQKLRAARIDSSEEILVIGIDFGTTYSGGAWATISDFEKGTVHTITSWPGTGREEGKAPTELCYEDDGITWGYNIQPESDPVRWFKLLLLKPEDLGDEVRDSEFLVRARRMMKENGKTAVDFIADYLRALWAHVVNAIKKARGEAIVESLAFHVVITVPAIWKDYARQSMREAAQKAGILDWRLAGQTKLTFAPEPEAAALCTLYELSDGVQDGNVYVICDAGGGTVDLITYQVNGVDPIEMDEAVEGAGGLCGGIFIDEAFEIMCQKRLGNVYNRLSRTSIKKIMKDEWEYGIKPQFDPGNPKKEYAVSLPAEAYKNGASLDDTSKEPHIKGGRIHLKYDNIRQVFSGVFGDIEKLIDQQIEATVHQNLLVTGIILVGGLGGSPYLYEHLKSVYAKQKIVVLQSGGIRPRTAICRGAVFKGFLDGVKGNADGPLANRITAPIMVTSTVSRASFGIVYRTRFDEKKHPWQDKVWDDDECEFKVRNLMEWYLKRGENVSKSEPLKKEFFRLYNNPAAFDKNFTISLFQSEDLTPPTSRGDSVKPLCELACTLDITWANLQEFTNANGKKIRKLEYELEMVPSGATVEFVLYLGGRKQGAQKTPVRV